MKKGQVPLLLVLDRITDVRNFGAIARTAECTGVHAIVIPTKGAAQINADAMKTSSGALNFLPVCREENLFMTIKYLQNSGIQVVACSEKLSKNIYEIDFTVPTAVIMGSEEDGISEELLRIVDELATIPMAGRVGSLNVSVATGVVLFEALRKRLVAAQFLRGKIDREKEPEVIDADLPRIAVRMQVHPVSFGHLDLGGATVVAKTHRGRASIEDDPTPEGQGAHPHDMSSNAR